MGHRALVAYRRSDGSYDLRYSHWGGEELALADSLSAGAPLSGGAVESDPLAHSIPFDRVLAAFVEPCVHEALYVVSPAFDVTPHRVLWLEWNDGRDGGRGAIVPVSPGERDVDLRGWFRGTKTTLADAIEMGALSRRAARSYLEARVHEDAGGRVYTYDGGRDGGGRRDDGGGRGPIDGGR